MPYCRYCGTENTAESKFCKECGRPPFGNASAAARPKLPLWKMPFWKIPFKRGTHPAVGTLGMLLTVIGLLVFCAKYTLGMTILSIGMVILIYAALTGNLKLFS